MTLTEAAAATVPILPVKNTVLLPQLVMPLSASRAGSVAAIEESLKTEDKLLVVVAQKDHTVEEPKGDDLYRIGTRSVIRRMVRTPNGVELIVQGLERVELLEVVQTTPFLQAKVQPLPMPTDNGPEVEALHRALLDQAKQLEEFMPSENPVGLVQLLSQASDPLHQVYLLSSIVNLSVEKDQSLLEAASREEALRLMHGYMAEELQIYSLRHRIASSVETEMSREKQEYLLRQQMRAIQRELGEKDPNESEVALLRERVEKAELPEEIRREADRELSRLERLPPAAPDYQISRSYLELLIELPWTKSDEETVDLARARKVLDEDHYGLKEIKERIVESLAVLKLNPKAKAPILCFVGPPGVGKTSLGESIARALGRSFARLSLGGLHDEAELRGHRRTYIGAMPGRIIQTIRRANANNPVMMLDEVDKLGRDFRGDPAAALLEILDPAQNHAFRDNYLDLPFDLSKVFFITTANTLDTIPQPLLDRMEIIRLAGYTEEEKAEIAFRYLLPRQLTETGLKPEQLHVPPETMAKLIRRYTREAGVRRLEQTIGRLCRKVAIRFAEGREEPVTVHPSDLAEMLGPERVFIEEARKQLLPGVATGLAWTEAGGEVLYIEAILLPEGQGLTLTGQLGEVMRESAQAASSYIWAKADWLGIDRSKLQRSGVHIHIPAGAVPKDGPSAGVTMATALASLYMDKPVRPDTAMTGEITLAGLVMPIGGVKEKVLAARRAGIRRIILPHDNAKDLPDVPQNVRDEMEFVFAEKIEDVLAAAIVGLTEPAADAPQNTVVEVVSHVGAEDSPRRRTAKSDQ